MASLQTSASAPDVLFPASVKQIPLYCSVCPDHPRFSDVSHLLTHIASKGHLHHETQTKLKAHQDPTAYHTLQQYEQWYRDNSIESLLVDRMRAKQVKEASRSRRHRALSIKKSRRSAPSRLIKTEHRDFSEDFPQDFPNLHGIFVPEDNDEMGDESFAENDMLSLKGQVWPGMGKMDLANEEMKRTRNQRKPKSVVEKMRRASEGIEPTQVVMTSQFDIERVKGVYDDESPVSDLEETPTPRRATRQRGKKPQPLAELSINVPRGNTRRATRGASGRSSKQALVSGLEQINSPIGPFKHSHDSVYGETKTGSSHQEPYSTALQAQPDPRFHSRGRLASLNPASHSNVMSPSASTQDIPCHLVGADMNRSRYHESPYLGPNGSIPLGSFGHQEASCMPNSGPVYQDGPHLPFSAPTHYDPSVQDHYRLHSHTSTSSKQDDRSQAEGEGSFSSSGSGLFISFNDTSINPLLSHDRQFINAFAQHLSGNSLESGPFTPTSQDLDFGQLSGNGREQRQMGNNYVKLESQLYEGLENQSPGDMKGGSFNAGAFWGAPNPETDLVLQEGLRHDGVGI